MSTKKYAVLFILLLALGTLVCSISNPILDFLFSVTLFVLIAIRAKMSFFTELAFILEFSYMQGVIHKQIGSISGSTLAWAGIKMPFYFDDLTIATISFLLTAYWFVLFTPILEREKAAYKNKIILGKFTVICFTLFALLMVILVFPSMPTLTFSQGSRARNDAIPYGLVILALVLLGLMCDSVKKQKWLKVIYAFVIFWIFGHGERVEILGFLSYLALKYINGMDLTNVKISVIKHRKKILYFVGIIFAMLAMWIGLKRGGASSISMLDIITGLLIQPTCGDVVYCFNCAADLWHTGKGLLGYTYIDYFLQLIPGSTGSFSAAEVLLRLRNTMGGSLFYSEAMMNFGLLGVVLSNIEFFVVMNLILKNKRLLGSWIWIPIVIEIFRIAWYGRSGWILAGFIELPILYFVTKKVLNKIRV